MQSVQDESRSFEAYATPKGVRLHSPNKSRSSPFKSATMSPFTSASRPSFKIVERPSLASLPGDHQSSEYATYFLEMQYWNGLGIGQGGEWTDEEDEGELGSGNKNENEDYMRDSEMHEEHSVALRDILLQAADTKQFDFYLMDTGKLVVIPHNCPAYADMFGRWRWLWVGGGVLFMGVVIMTEDAWQVFSTG